MLPFLVWHCAWLITHCQVMSDGTTPCERLRGRPYQGQVAEFAEVVHFKDPGKAADMDDRWNLGLWLGKSLASDEHYVGTSGGVRRCRSTWRRPEKQRWDRKMLTDMNGEPWNPTGHHQDKPPQVRGVYITLERQTKHGRKVVRHVSGMQRYIRRKCKRFKDMEDNEAAQTAASASEPNAEMREQAAGVVPRPVQAVAPAVGRPAPEDANMEPAESLVQPTSSVVRMMEDEDNTSAIFFLEGEKKRNHNAITCGNHLTMSISDMRKSPITSSCLEVEQRTGESLRCTAAKNGHPSHPPCLFRPPSEDCRLIPREPSRAG